VFTRNATRFHVLSRSIQLAADEAATFVTLRVSVGLDGAVSPTSMDMSDPLMTIPSVGATSFGVRGAAVCGRPTTRRSASVSVDGVERLSLTLTGERRWRPGGGASTPPLPWSHLPLDAHHAFGGATKIAAGEMEGLPHPEFMAAYPRNPSGKGFVPPWLAPEAAELPNVEFSDALVKDVRDRPDPAVLCPGPNDVAAILPTEPSDATAAYEQLTHWSHPRCFLETQRRPFRLVASGFSDEALVFDVPSSPVRVSMKRRGVWHEVPSHVRRFVLNLDARAVEVIYGHSAHHETAPRVSDVRLEEV
jgi:hypothetical protein